MSLTFGNGFKHVTSSGSRLDLTPEKARQHAHGPVAIVLEARQRARTFAFGNGFTHVMGSGSRLVLKPERPEKHAHGAAAIALGARQRARAFTFCSGLKNAMGTGSRLAIKPERLETTHVVLWRSHLEHDRARVYCHASARALYARVVSPRADFSWFELTIKYIKELTCLQLPTEEENKERYGIVSASSSRTEPT